MPEENCYHEKDEDFALVNIKNIRQADQGDFVTQKDA